MRHKTAVRFKENVKVCMEVASLPEPAPEPCCFYPVKQPGKAGAEAASGGLKKPKKAYILTTILTTLTTILTTKNGLVGTCKSRSEYSKKRRRWDSNPRSLLGDYPISSRGRYDHFDTPPYNESESIINNSLRKSKSNRNLTI